MEDFGGFVFRWIREDDDEMEVGEECFQKSFRLEGDDDKESLLDLVRDGRLEFHEEEDLGNDDDDDDNDDDPRLDAARALDFWVSRILGIIVCRLRFLLRV